jgi:phosphoserine phosphatase
MHVIHRGRPLAIEAKAPGEVPTRRQERTIKQIQQAGGRVMVISGNYEELEQWLAL